MIPGILISLGVMAGLVVGIAIGWLIGYVQAQGEQCNV